MLLSEHGGASKNLGDKRQMKRRMQKSAEGIEAREMLSFNR
jgi:hypothetical protein